MPSVNVKPLYTDTAAGVTGAAPLQITADQPCQVTVKAFDPNDATKACKPFTVTASPGAYTISAGDFASVRLAMGQSITCAPTAADPSLSMSYSAEQFSVWREGES